MRLKEHRYAVKTKDSRNGIAVHADTHSHEVDWQAAKVLMFEEQGEFGCLRVVVAQW